MNGLQVQAPIWREHADKGEVKKVKAGDAPVVIFMGRHSSAWVQWRFIEWYGATLFYTHSVRLSCAIIAIKMVGKTGSFLWKVAGELWRFTSPYAGIT